MAAWQRDGGDAPAREDLAGFGGCVVERRLHLAAGRKDIGGGAVAGAPMEWSKVVDSLSPLRSTC